MSITVTDIGGTRRGGWSVDGGRTYSLGVRVGTGDPSIGPRAALMSIGVGAGSTYRFPLTGPATEWDYAAFLNSVEVADEDRDGKGWTCTLEYKPFDWRSLSGGSGDGSNASAFLANPLNARPLLKWSSSTEEIACTHDRYGNPILNTAGDPFDPPLTRPYSTPIATITRTLATFDPDWIVQYKDHVNASTWMGNPAGTVLCKEINADAVYDADWGWMWSQTLEFAFRPIIILAVGTPSKPWILKNAVLLAGWAKQILNAGLRQLVSGAVKPINIDNAPISQPVPLKSNGTYDPAADPVYLTFDIYETAEFADFNLPADLFSASAGGSPVGGS